MANLQKRSTFGSKCGFSSPAVAVMTDSRHSEVLVVYDDLNANREVDETVKCVDSPVCQNSSHGKISRLKDELISSSRRSSIVCSTDEQSQSSNKILW